jgi:hypothetical protein
MATMFFLSKNYVSALDTINVSSGDLLKTRLCDQKSNLLWQSSGETGESGYNTYIEIIFFEGANAVNRAYDTILLQNINLKQFKLQNYAGGVYTDIPGAAYTVNADNSVRIKLASPVTGSRIKLLMQSTIVAGQEKYVGEFWVMLETLNLAQVFTTRNRGDYYRGGDYYLANGSLSTYRLFSKATFTWEMANLSDDDYQTLKGIYDQHAILSFYPDYTRDIDGIYLMQWTGIFKGTTHPKISINNISIELKEQ